MKHFLITSPARSGSTSLRETLNEIGGTICHGEILAPARVLGISNKMPAADLTKAFRASEKAEFYSRLLEPEGVGACGFKLLFHQFFAPGNAYYVHRFLSGKPRVVFIWRRNLLARLQSDFLLRISVGQRSIEEYQALSEEEIALDCRQQMEMAGWVRNLLDLYAIRDVLFLDFEELISDASAVTRIVDFLGLDTGDVVLGRDARTEKTRKRGEKPAPGPAFASPGLGAFTDVSLEEAWRHFSG